MTPLRIAIVDDEPPARRKIRRLLARIPQTEVVGEAGSGAEALQLLAGIDADLLFLDIQMPDMDGFALLRELKCPSSMQIVFTTAFDEHALKAFEVQALDYLLKPVAPLRFEQAVERARSRVSGLQPQVSQARAILARVRRRPQRLHSIPVTASFLSSPMKSTLPNQPGIMWSSTRAEQPMRSAALSSRSPLSSTRLDFHVSIALNLSTWRPLRSLSPGFTAIARCGSATASN